VYVGIDNYRQLVDDPIFWQSLLEQPLVRDRHDPGVDRARASDGGVGERQGRRPRRVAPRVFHADGAADDRVANIWLFFYTPEYGLLERVLGAFGFASHNWLGSKSTALACLMVVTIWKEAGFS
jgi:sn-glycerol 3-phosphate transport system permease protein